jgi:hypothetical protein
MCTLDLYASLRVLLWSRLVLVFRQKNGRFQEGFFVLALTAPLELLPRLSGLITCIDGLTRKRARSILSSFSLFPPVVEIPQQNNGASSRNQGPHIFAQSPFPKLPHRRQLDPFSWISHNLGWCKWCRKKHPTPDFIG